MKRALLPLLALTLAMLLFIACDNTVALFDGHTLKNWVVPEGDNGHWKVVDGIIDYDGKSESESDKNLWTKKEYSDFILKLDWRFPGEPVEREVPLILPDGTVALNEDSTQKMVPVQYAGDSGVYLRGNSKSQINIWCWPIGSGEIYGYRTDENQPPEVVKGTTPLKCADKPLGEWNSFVITMRGDRVSVDLNGEKVIDNCQLPGVPEKGRIALQHHGDPIQFRNITIKEL
ncbi:DUF1080 domain-containing protein [candidate division KSB1 bacterium]|nr:DUF1080 domain-containing protein [candidate division KSB1 bacterium]